MAYIEDKLSMGDWVAKHNVCLLGFPGMDNTDWEKNIKN